MTLEQYHQFLCATLEYLCEHKTISSDFEKYKTLQVMKEILKKMENKK